MYEYIKGTKFESSEHMLSATEIAALYGICKHNGKPNGEKYIPNPIVVSAILKDYVIMKNLNVSEIYYPHSHGCLRVYPKSLYQPVLDEMIYKLKLEERQHQDLYYRMLSENKTYKYIYIKPDKVISFDKIRKG